MKKFDFKLQSILNHRLYLKKIAQADLSKSLAVEREIEDSLEKIAQNYKNVKSSTSGTTDFSVFFGANQYYKLLEQKKEELLSELAEAKIVTEQKREVLRQAMKNTKALEKLRDKRFEEWQEQALREEELILDEINSGTRFPQ